MYQRSSVMLSSWLVLGEVGCVIDGSGDGEQVVGLCGLEELENSGAHARGEEPHAFVLTPYEVPDDEAESAGVHVGDIGEVEDVDRSGVTRGGFRFEEVL